MNDSRFGRHLRAHWHLDDTLTYLNHGTVGATPKAVLAHQQELLVEIERNPAKFILRELTDTSGVARDTRMRLAAARVAEFVGAKAEDVVPVDNITTAANAVLRSFPLRAGDEIVTTSLGYGGVTNVASFVARTSGAGARVIALPAPGASPATYAQRVISGLSDKTRMLVIDHIAAETALILPIREIAAECRARDIAVFVDGAHAPGNIPVNIPSLNVDYYAANLHKWALAPRSTGFLWVAPSRQTAVHAAVISWGLDNGIAAEFETPGTRDPSAFLSAPFALDFLAQLGGSPEPSAESGGVAAVLSRNHDLAWSAAQMLSAGWGVPFATPESMIGAMATVRLPARFGVDREAAAKVQQALAAERIEVPVYAIQDELWVRISAQVYCDEADIQTLLDAVNRL